MSPLRLHFGAICNRVILNYGKQVKWLLALAIMCVLENSFRSQRIGAQAIILRGGSAGGNLRAGPDLNDLWILDCRWDLVSLHLPAAQFWKLMQAHHALETLNVCFSGSFWRWKILTEAQTGSRVAIGRSCSCVRLLISVLTT